MHTLRVPFTVSRETDVALRSYLAMERLPEGTLSKFVEQAVRKEVLSRISRAIKARNL
jgi:dsRNA-specific ribonuclease